jgi:hypothetical protein
MDITNLTSAEQAYLGVPAVIEGLCSIYPVTLRDIGKIGVKKFYSYLNYFTLKKEDIDSFLKENNFTDESMTVFQFHLINSLIDENYKNDFQKAFSFFLHTEEMNIARENEAIILGDIKDGCIIKQEEFDLICKIISFQNNVDNFKAENESNPSDSKAAAIIKKLKEGRKVREKKNNSNLSFIDLVASLAARGNGINAINVWDLTYYAFNDQFKRMQMIEEYESARSSLLAGADPKKVELKNWLRPIEKEE